MTEAAQHLDDATEVVNDPVVIGEACEKLLAEQSAAISKVYTFLKTAEGLLEELEGAIDKQTCDTHRKADLPDDAELDIVLEAGDERKLSQAIRLIKNAIVAAEGKPT
jgi:hypothetical protein